MRISERSIYEAAQVATSSARDRMERATIEAATGMRLRSPGDDPVAAAQEVRINAEVGAHQSSTQVLREASSELEVVDGALGGMSDAVQRAYELAVASANGVLTATEREQAALEVDGLLHQMVTLSNTKVADRYLFGGTEDGSPPFDEVGSYLGKQDVRQIEIYPGIVHPVSVRVDGALRGTSGGVDTLAALKSFAAALRSNDQAAVADSIGALSAGSDQIDAVRVQAGTSHNMLTMATSAAEAAQLSAVERKSKLTEVDPFEAATKLSLAQRAMEAAISASASSFKFTLLDKLG